MEEKKAPRFRQFAQDTYRTAQVGLFSPGGPELFCMCAPEIPEARIPQAVDEDSILARKVSANVSTATPSRATNSRDNAGDESAMPDKDSWEQMWGSSCDHPLMAALRLHSSHSVELQQELAKFAAGLGDLRNLNDVDVEKLRRIVIEYDVLGLKSVAATDWLVEDYDSVPGCSYGARLDDDMFQWFRIIELRDSDIVKAFALYLEVDLARNFAEDLISAEALGTHTEKKDAGWRTVARTKPYHVKEDNIWVYSGIDALDKPIRSLIVLAYTPPKPKLSGVPFIPPPENGFVRSAFDCTIHCFQPMFSGKASIAPCGFRLIQLGVSRPSAAVWSDSVSTTAMQCIKDGTGDIMRFPLKLKRYLDTSRHLEARMEKSPRSPLYERVKRHVEALWPCTASV